MPNRPFHPWAGMPDAVVLYSGLVVSPSPSSTISGDEEEALRLDLLLDLAQVRRTGVRVDVSLSRACEEAGLADGVQRPRIHGGDVGRVRTVDSYAFYSSRSPGNGVPEAPGSWLAIVVELTVMPFI